MECLLGLGVVGSGWGEQKESERKSLSLSQYSPPPPTNPSYSSFDRPYSSILLTPET